MRSEAPPSSRPDPPAFYGPTMDVSMVEAPVSGKARREASEAAIVATRDESIWQTTPNMGAVAGKDPHDDGTAT